MRFTIGLLCLVISLLFGLTNSKGETFPSTAFIYSEPPESLIYLYDWIVVEPTIFPPEKLKEKYYMKKRGKVIAYLSIGEIQGKNSLPKECLLGENKRWKTKILDLRNRNCFQIIENKAKELLENYDGVFLDTLDSYQLVLSTDKWKDYESKEIQLIKELKSEFPGKLILVNRAFYIFSQIKKYIDGFVVESLLRGFDAQGNYIKMNETETEYLLSKLQDIKKSGIPVIVVDYLPPEKEKERRELAKKIFNLGFIPWVTDRNLKTVGEGIYHVIKRQILLIYDPDLNPIYPDIHRLIQMPLEWLGFSPKLIPVTQLPSGFLADRIRGIVVWNIQGENKKKKLIKWIKEQIDKGIKVFFISVDNFNSSELKKIGIVKEPNITPGENFSIVKTYGPYGFEIKAFPAPSNYVVYPEKGTPLILLKNSKGQKFVPVAITPWGGYSCQNYLLKNVFNNDLWVFDPFWLFRKVFGNIPAPDVTTENGARVLTVQIDGDGFTGKSLVEPGKIDGEVVRDLILKKFKLPTTASVIVAEVDPKGLFPKKAPLYERVARSIFSLPYVEAASHTYSHPFNWHSFILLSEGKLPSTSNLPYGIYLKVPGYKPSLYKEIIWSIDFISKNLCPDKKKAKVLLWSGDCLPPKEAIRLTYKIAVYNVNGGDTDISDTVPFLSHVSPMGINRGNYFQVFAPFQNENVYTDNWKFKTGYKRVISGFQLTEKPRRLKPISIYFHYYSAYYPSTLKTLETVYKWALSQDVIPLFLSEYAQKVMEFRGSSLATFNTGKEGLVFCSSGQLNTLRLDNIDGKLPSIKNSSGVLGYRKINNSLYISFSKNRCRVLELTKNPKNSFYLIKANGHVNVKRSDSEFLVEIKSHVPIKAVFYIERNCNFKGNGKITIKQEKGIVRISSQRKTEIFKVYCQN